MSQLPRWFDDYNESHPHKALRLKSPREFIRRSAVINPRPVRLDRGNSNLTDITGEPSDRVAPSTLQDNCFYLLNRCDSVAADAASVNTHRRITNFRS
jgi:hypothetical protein